MRSRRGLAAAAALGLAVLGAGACGSSEPEEPPPNTARGVSDGLALAQLERLLVDRVPEDFVLAPDGTLDTGPTDLDAAVRFQGGDAATRTFFEENGFNGGYQRLWVNGRSNELLVFLYQYATPTGAHAQTRAVEQSIRANEDSASLRSFRPGFPESVGLLAPEGGRWIAAILFSKGDYWAMVRYSGEDAETTREDAVAVARDQYDRLP